MADLGFLNGGAKCRGSRRGKRRGGRVWGGGSPLPPPPTGEWSGRAFLRKIFEFGALKDMLLYSLKHVLQTYITFTRNWSVGPTAGFINFSV